MNANLKSGHSASLRPLVACLALALGAVTALGYATSALATPPDVTNCDDHGSGSLRAAVASAVSGDTVDLSQLSCSSITLYSGALHVDQSSLTITGPVATTLTIGSDQSDRVIKHTGGGTLKLSDLAIQYGVSTDSGGCLYSSGSLTLTNTTVSKCTVVAASALGGGIFTAGDLSLYASILTGNIVVGTGTNAVGGGAVVHGDFKSKYSTISENQAGGAMSYAGGVATYGAVQIESSTLSGNRARIDGALLMRGTGPAVIRNSTLSQNSAAVVSAVFAQIPLTLANSTITLNDTNSGGGAVYVTSNLTLQSSIIAGNENIASVRADDLEGGAAVITSNSSHNLITTSTLQLPADTRTDCPRLGPLADNGGPTLTHALLHSSPAIDAGSNVFGLTEDQRGASRVFGSTADIGAVEWQGDDDDGLFASRFEPVCD